MKKLLLPLAIGSALSLVGCGSGDEAPVTETEVSVAASRVVFDPSNGEVPAPSNILLSESKDGTLNIPVDNPDDVANPQVALNGLDGWGTHSPITFEFSLPVDENGEEVTIEAASLEAEGSIRVFQTTQGGPANAASCISENPVVGALHEAQEAAGETSTIASSPGAVCSIDEELVQNEDFLVSATGDGSVAIIPTKPFTPETGYLVVLTDNIQDSLGRSVKASQTYTLMKRSVAENPASDTRSARNLQSLINTYEGALDQAGVDTEGVIYSSNFTTQSVGNVLNVIKQQYAVQIKPSLTLNNSSFTLAQAMASEGLNPPDSAALANYYTGNVTLPYYSAHPDSATNSDPREGRWRAACDSPVAILNAVQATEERDQLKNTDLARLPSGFTEDPTLLLPPNCFSLETNSGAPVDKDRLVTKYNPFPVPSIQAEIDVIASIPNGANERTMPANGWPVVIFQHGITADKSSMFGIAGTLASQGIATVAIDHPLHGERGFELTDEDGNTFEYIASGDNGSATAYMNLESLLTTRDNLRQSVSDLLGLRYSLTDVTGPQLDSANVHFVGHSLGAIAGISFTQIANSETNADFNVKASALGMPGGSIADFLLASDSFGPVVKNNLMYGQISEFTQLVNSQAEQAGVTAQQLLTDVDAAASLFDGFSQQAGAATISQIEANLFNPFAFAAQTVIDSGDPVNYAEELAENTPVFVIESDGDTVIPNKVENDPLAGTQPLVKLMRLSAEIPPVPVDPTGSQVSGYASFVGGTHSSLLDPTPDGLDPEVSSAVTEEMQTQILKWFGSNLMAIPVTNEEVVE